MSVELSMLAWSALLTLLLAVPYALGLILERGLPAMAGNRENFAEVAGWKGRSIRAHKNMVENLIPFAAVVLVAQAAGISNESTILGAQLFLGSRVIHAIVYTLGVPWVRTLAYAGGLIGTIMIFMQIIGGGAPAA
jgi:uncharacterized MAPEG superfamily protein